MSRYQRMPQHHLSRTINNRNMATSVTVRSSNGSRATVVISVSSATIPFDIKSKLGPFSEGQVLDQKGKQHEGRSYQAWESACHSGLLYAYRRTGCNGITAIIESISGKVNEEDATGFAVASEVALRSELGIELSVNQKDQAGWTVVSVEKNPTLKR